MRFDEMTPEERKALGSKGGKKGGTQKGINAQKRKTLQETLSIIMSLPIKKGNVKKIESATCLDDLANNNTDVQTALLTTLTKMALKENTKAYDLLFEQLNRNTEQANVEEEIQSAEDDILMVVKRVADNDNGV